MWEHFVPQRCQRTKVSPGAEINYTGMNSAEPPFLQADAEIKLVPAPTKNTELELRRRHEAELWPPAREAACSKITTVPKMGLHRLTVSLDVKEK